MKVVNILFVSNNSNSLFSFGNAKRVQKMRKINMEKDNLITKKIFGLCLTYIYPLYSVKKQGYKEIYS
jgi:hypothetical protein